jgi:hypothetical protein
MARQLCAVPVCSAIARRTVLRERYCEACAASVEQAAYMQSLPAKSAEHVLYRHTFATSPPEGVTIPEPLATAPRTGWRSRR